MLELVLEVTLSLWTLMINYGNAWWRHLILPQRLISVGEVCAGVGISCECGSEPGHRLCGASQRALPCLQRFQFNLFKRYSFIHSFIFSFMHSTCGDACSLCTRLWSGARDSYQQDRATVCFHGAVILVEEMYSKNISGSINRVMKGSWVFWRK